MKRFVVLSVLALALSGLFMGCDTGGGTGGSGGNKPPATPYYIIVKEYYWSQEQLAEILANSSEALASFDEVYAVVNQLALVTGPGLPGFATYAEFMQTMNILPQTMQNQISKQLAYSGNAIAVFGDGWIYIEQR